MNTELTKQAKKRLLYVNEQFCFWKEYGECNEAQRY